MSEMRYDPIHDIWVIIAEERLRRPYQFSQAEAAGGRPDAEAAPGILKGEGDIPGFYPEGHELSCPFCEGHERETPQERDAVISHRRKIREALRKYFQARGAVAQGEIPPETPIWEELTIDDYRNPNSPGWIVRSVPNRYASVHPWEEWTPQRFGMNVKTPGVGMQEVIVDTPRHVERFGLLDPEEMEYLIHFYHRRLHQLRKEHKWRYAQLFKNQGAAAGASMRHIHTQIFCLPYVPHVVNSEKHGLRKHAHNTGRCYYCQTLEQEMGEPWRFIGQSEFMVAICPFAPRFYGEIWILPKRHVPCFVQSSREELDDLAVFLRKIIRRLEEVLPIPAYNVVLHNSPWDYDATGVKTDPHFHWRLEILPRANCFAGFEAGTGNYINPCSPERFTREMGRVE